MKFLLFFGSLFASLLYRHYGGGLWPFWVWVAGYIGLWAKYGRKSWYPRLLLFGTALVVEIQGGVVSGGYERFLTRLSPGTAYWLDPECYGYEGLWFEIPRFVATYSGLRSLWHFNFNRAAFGYTLPELLLLTVCVCTLLGLLVAVLHQEQLSAKVSGYMNWSSPKGEWFAWFLAGPLRFPQWVAVPFGHRGWNAGIRLAVLPFTLALLLLGTYAYLLFRVFLLFPARLTLYFIGMDMDSLKKQGSKQP